MQMLDAIKQKSIIDFQQDMQDLECDNCGGKLGKTIITAIDEKHDEVYYGNRCEDCGVLNE